MKVNASICSRILLLLLAIFVASAQDPTGSLEGIITDPSGGRIPNAAVTLRNVATDFSLKQQSESDGSFRFSGLPIGNYDLTASSNGFQSA